MDKPPAALPVLQKRWDSTCRVLFGKEVGRLEEFGPWLSDMGERLVHRKSAVSGNDVTYAIRDYAEGSRWISFDEIDFTKKAAPLPAGIDGINNIGLIVSLLQGRFYYAGSAVLGNSQYVEKSSGITDCFYMLQTGKLTECKYIAYSVLGRLNEDGFGVNGNGESAMCVKCCETFRDRRCFELWQSRSCSDCYYSHNLDDCQECFFCFNAKNLRHAIGNVQLPKEKYYEVKKRLQTEMAEKLAREKRLPSLVEIAAKCPKPSAPRLSAPATPEKADKAVIEEAFAKTCNIVLGRRLQGSIDDYAEWLKRNIRRSETLKSAASGKPVRRFDYCEYFALPPGRLLTREEAREAGEKLKIGEKEAESLSLANAHESIGKIAFFCPEYRDGMNLNIIECATCGDSAHCYRSSPVVFSKYAGYCFWPRSSEHAFGCAALLSSEFNIRCFNSVKLARCFEVDFSRDCSGCYYCHNVENCTDCMLCFNAKNLRYAVGNVEVGRERFMEMKKRLLGLAGKELEETKGLHWGIYNIGAQTG
ncbi:MAG: hypothetical protein NTX79_06455 [Candidatus Micrarchaeota archaeon]|nr:hypothetical protein [Candidatus Micrarchaeota archaeon]